MTGVPATDGDYALVPIADLELLIEHGMQHDCDPEVEGCPAAHRVRALIEPHRFAGWRDGESASCVCGLVWPCPKRPNDLPLVGVADG